jgi:hypothetical protein
MSASKNRTILFILFTFFLTWVYGTDNKYKVNDIAKDLLVDAKAVVRTSETVFEISDIDKAVMSVKYVITILNTNGIDNSVLIKFYDKFLSVRKIRSDLYDQNGIPIKNGINVDVKDYSANAGYSLYEDNRVKLLDPKYRTTPFTVEFTYEIVYNGLLFYPDWFVYNDYNVSVEKSTFTIITPNEFKFRYMENNIKDRVTINKGKDKTTYTWKAENMPAIKNEPFGTPFQEHTSNVLTAPSDFEISGYKGNLESWSSFGKWINMLGKGRNTLPTESGDKIRKLVSGMTDDYEKIKVLYNYLQNKVRYVSIQKGIGGWQTINAETVDRLSYGDCKALSNYMKSLLDVVGIKSYYTLANAGEDATPIKAAFPSNQFNHVIICVPFKNDTLWLECTSQHLPFGYIGTFTDDRKVLLTSEDGSALVNTKKYTIDDNKQIRSATVSLGEDGNATAIIKTDYRGALYDKVYWVLQMDEADRRKDVQTRITVPSFKLINFSHREERNIIPSIKEELFLGLPDYGIIMGNRFLFNPNLMTKFGKLPYKTKERKSEISIRRSYNEIDTITFKLPVSYKIGQIPEKVSVLTKFGQYTTEISFFNNTIRYIRTFKFFKGLYPVSDYSDFVDFCDKVSINDESKIALTKIL